MIDELREFGCKIDVYDPWADKEEVKYEYNLDLVKNIELSQYTGIVVAVAHDEFKELDLSDGKEAVVYDIKSLLNNADGRL